MLLHDFYFWIAGFKTEFVTLDVLQYNAGVATESLYEFLMFIFV